MTEDDDERRPDEAKADEVERELDEMDERQGNLGGEIGDAGEQWDRHKSDDRVPGATGKVVEEDQQAEAQPDQELDFGRDIESEDVVGDQPQDRDDDSEDRDDEDDSDDDSEDRDDEVDSEGDSGEGDESGDDDR